MGLTQSQAAEYIGISPTAYRYLEQVRKSARGSDGHFKGVAIQTANFFCFEPCDLFGGKPIDIECFDAVLTHSSYSRDSAVDVATAYDLAEMKWLIGVLLESLPGRDKKVLRMRFGFGEYFGGITLDSVAKDIGVTRERVRQIELKSLYRLRARKRLLGKLFAFKSDPSVDSLWRPCSQCFFETSGNVFICEKCGSQVCSSCWFSNDSLCAKCFWERPSAKKKTEQVNIEPLGASARRTKKKRKKPRRGLSHGERQRLKYEQEQKAIIERARTGKGFLPQCVEEMLAGYFKRLAERCEFESQVARGREYYKENIANRGGSDGEV